MNRSKDDREKQLQDAKTCLERYKTYLPADDTAKPENIEVLKVQYDSLQKNPCFSGLKQIQDDLTEARQNFDCLQQDIKAKEETASGELRRYSNMTAEDEKRARLEWKKALEASAKSREECIRLESEKAAADKTCKENHQHLIAQYNQEPLPVDILDLAKDFDVLLQEKKKEIYDAEESLKSLQAEYKEQSSILSWLEGKRADSSLADGNEGTGRTPWSSVSLYSYKETAANAEMKIEEAKQQQRQHHRDMQQMMRVRIEAYQNDLNGVYEEFLSSLKGLYDLLMEQPLRLGEFASNHERTCEVIQQRLNEVLAVQQQDAQIHDRVVEMILNYVRSIDSEMRRIAVSTIVDLGGHRRPLMKIERDALKEDRIYFDSVDRFLQSILDKRRSAPAEQKKGITSSLLPADLFAAAYKSIRTRIYVLKPEPNDSYSSERWNSIASQQSTGERAFASAVPLCALLYYQRNGALSSRTGVRNWTTLYLDNLFANVQSSFILDPLFKLFEAACMQVVTFTYISSHDVVKNFSVIKLMKTVSYQGGHEVLAVEDRTAESASSSSMQMYLQNIREIPLAI